MAEESCVEESIADTESISLQTRLASISIPYKLCQRVQVGWLSLIVIVYLGCVASVLFAPNSDRLESSCHLNSKKISENHKDLKENGSNKKQWLTWGESNASTFCPCNIRPCVRKCCPKGQKLASPETLTCVKYLSDSSPTNRQPRFNDFSKDIFNRLNPGEDLRSLQPIDKSTHTSVITGMVDCTKSQGWLGARRVVRDTRVFSIEDGSLLTEDLFYLPMDEYCVDLTFTTSTIRTVICEKVTLLHEATTWMLRDRSHVEWLALVLSQVSLLVTLLVYIYLPYLHTLHGKMLMAFLSCVFVNLMQFFWDYRYLPKSFGYIWQLSCLGEFFWLTAIFFDIWVQFRECPVARSVSHERMRLLGYSLICWGLPLLLVVLTWAMHVVPNLSDSCTKPRYKDDSCKFNVEVVTRLFLNLPVVTTSALCVVLYLSSLYNIRFNPRFYVQTAFGSPCSRNVDSAKKWLVKYGKVGQMVLVCNLVLLIVAAPWSQDSAPLVQPLTAIYYGQGIWLAVVLLMNRHTIRQLYLGRLQSRMC